MSTFFQHFLCAGAALLILAGPTHAQAAAPAISPEPTAFDIAVRTPPEFTTLKELVEKHIELQRYRAVTDLDDAELARLMALAVQDVRRLVGTLGYFSPVIGIARENGLRPVIAISITPGPATTTHNTSISFAGDIGSSTDPAVSTQKGVIQNNWLLPHGQRFTQDAWDSAKTQALRDLVGRRYPAGKIESSLADIDPATSQANLSLKLDSGPLYRLGPLQVTGVSRYNPVLVPRLAQLNVGAAYDQKALIDAQQRVSASGYFDSATIFIDPDNGDPQAVPVQVQVREARLQKVVLGLGASTDSGPRVSLEHTHNKAAGTDWRAVTKLQLEKNAPSAQTEWTSLPDEANWRWVGLARAERIDDNTLITTAQRLRFGRTQQSERIDRNIYVQYDRARVTGAGLAGNTNADTGDGSAVSGNYVWTGRYFDSLPFPRKGYGLGFELGGGFTLSAAANAQRQPFTRGVARWLGIHTLDGSRVAMRAEAGAVLAKDTARVPSGSLFRTGGDSTVRGYGYRDIGIKLPSGNGVNVIGPGRYVAIGSAEWQRPLKSNGLPTDWENTVFIDAGGVADRPQELRASVGIGTGMRWKSPIGPLQIDLAYGVKVRQLRLHTSVGFVF